MFMLIMLHVSCWIITDLVYLEAKLGLKIDGNTKWFENIA